MKKLLVIGALSSMILTNSMADTKTYLGIELASGVTQFSGGGNYDGKISDNFSDTKLVLGKGIGENNYIQLYFSNTKYDSNIFVENVGGILNNDLKSKEFGFEWLKKVPQDNNTSPFIKVGAGIASIKLENGVSNDNYATALSLTLGTGLDFNVNDSFSILTGLDYNFKNWQSFNVTDYTGQKNNLNISQNSLKIYLGANLKF